MFLVLILYICWLKKEDRLVNIFLIVFSYAFLFIIDNITHLIWSIVGLEVSVYWPIYMLIDYPIFFFIIRLISRKVTNIKKKKYMALSSKILIAIGGDLILCMLIFIMHISATEQIGYTTPILFVSIILYTAYFVLTIFMIIMIVNTYETNAKIMVKQNSYDNLQEYMGQIEDVYQNLRSFKHDHANIMASMAGYVESGDMDGLREYYDKQVFPINNKLRKEKDAIAKLHNLEIIELKSLIAVKLNYAQELNIEINLEIIEKIDRVEMDIIDLARVIGVLLDNAVEACQECREPSINLSMIKMNTGITIIVKNTYVKQELDYSKLGNMGVSSKGEHRGTGLYNIKVIVNKYNNVIIDTEYKKDQFTQILEIYDNI